MNIHFVTKVKRTKGLVIPKKCLDEDDRRIGNVVLDTNNYYNNFCIAMCGETNLSVLDLINLEWTLESMLMQAALGCLGEGMIEDKWKSKESEKKEGSVKSDSAQNLEDEVER